MKINASSNSIRFPIYCTVIESMIYHCGTQGSHNNDNQILQNVKRMLMVQGILRPGEFTGRFSLLRYQPSHDIGITYARS